jgi:hypothetical protein
MYLKYFQAARIPAEGAEGGQPADTQPAPARKKAHSLLVKVGQTVSF